MVENMVCAFSPINGIGFFSPLMAPIKPISQRTKNTTLTIQLSETNEAMPVPTSDEKNIDSNRIPNIHDVAIDIKWNNKVCRNW